MNTCPPLTARVAEIDRVRGDCDMNFTLSDLDNLTQESSEGTKRVRQIATDLRDFSHVDSPDVTQDNINELITRHRVRNVLDRAVISIGMHAAAAHIL